MGTQPAAQKGAGGNCKKGKEEGQKGGREERKGSGSDTGGCAVQRKCQAKRESFFWGEHRLVVLIYSLRISVYGEDKLKAEQRKMQISGRKMLSSDQAFDAAVEDLQKTQGKEQKEAQNRGRQGRQQTAEPLPGQKGKNQSDRGGAAQNKAGRKRDPYLGSAVGETGCKAIYGQSRCEEQRLKKIGNHNSYLRFVFTIFYGEKRKKLLQCEENCGIITFGLSSMPR